MLKGKLFWGIASLVMYGCSVTPSGVEWGRSVLADADAVLVDASENPGPGGQVGFRELLEGALATGFGLNFLRNRKYTMTRKPSGDSEA